MDRRDFRSPVLGLRRRSFFTSATRSEFTSTCLAEPACDPEQPSSSQPSSPSRIARWPNRDTASRKSIKEALAYLDRNLPGLRRGTARYDYLIGRVKSSGRPLTTAKSICRDYLNVGHRAPEHDASDVQALWVKVLKRQGRVIYPAQKRIFR